jgi:hypothetical protein
MTGFAYSSDLPWGSWMRTSTSGSGSVTIVDEKGRHWQSIRDAFWAGRLRMSLANRHIQQEQLELMLADLASRHRGIVAPPERQHLLFGGDHQFLRFFSYWMHAEGLVDGTFRNEPLGAKPSAEGLSVLRMLAATRPLELNAIPIGRAAVELFGDPDTENECSRERFAAAEIGTRTLRFAFIRELVFDEFAISLLYRNPKDTIPLARTIWSMRFSNEHLRDRTYQWMHGRIDRWTSLGEIVLKNGASALTEHFLMLAMASNRIDPVNSADCSVWKSHSITYKP